MRIPPEIFISQYAKVFFGVASLDLSRDTMQPQAASKITMYKASPSQQQSALTVLLQPGSH